MHISVRLHSTAPENLDTLRLDMLAYGFNFAPDTLRGLCKHLHDSYYSADAITDCGGICIPSVTFHGSDNTAATLSITSRGCDTIEIICFAPLRA